MNILIIDDEPDCCDALEFFIQAVGRYTIYKSGDGIEALGLIKPKQIDLIFSDVNLPALSGIELIKIAKHRKKDVIVVLISGKKDIISSINAIEHGAFDFIPKPADGSRIEQVLKQVELRLQEKTPAAFPNFQITKMADDSVISLDESLPRDCIHSHASCKDVGFFSEAARNICHKLEKLGHYPDIPVLLEGKTGTGKEVFARYLHDNAPHSAGPFVAINCATIAKDLFESELFGYTAGAFTGAAPGGREGKIKLAEGGTLFLDEITEIPLTHQSKLLRVLQEREYYRVGSSTKQTVHTCFVCAANTKIARQVKNQLFREDLYYRLNICRIHIPPLKQRKEEIVPLALLFLRELNRAHGTGIKGVEAGFLKRLLSRDWPGNVRELKNTLTRITLFNEGEIIQTGSLELLAEVSRKTAPSLDAENFSLPDGQLDLEKLIQNIILKALDKFAGNKTRTAAYLRIPRKKLYHRYNAFPGKKE